MRFWLEGALQSSHSEYDSNISYHGWPISTLNVDVAVDCGARHIKYGAGLMSIFKKHGSLKWLIIFIDICLLP